MYDVSEKSFEASKAILEEYKFKPIKIKEFVTSFDDLYFMPVYKLLEKERANESIYYEFERGTFYVNYQKKEKRLITQLKTEISCLK